MYVLCINDSVVKGISSGVRKTKSCILTHLSVKSEKQKNGTTSWISSQLSVKSEKQKNGTSCILTQLSVESNKLKMVNLNSVVSGITKKPKMVHLNLIISDQ